MPPGKKPASATGTTTDGKTPSQVKGYKPPWIKEAAEPNQETQTPWGIMKKRDCINDPEEAKKVAASKQRARDDDDDEGANFSIPTLRKVSLKTEKLENGDTSTESKDTAFVKPALKSVRTKEPKPITREESKSKIVIPKLNSVKVEKMKELPPPPKKDKADFRNVLKKVPTQDRIDDEKKRGAPMAPPMPPPPPMMPKLIDTTLNDKQKAMLDALKSRPKVRPDWTALLKGIETGAKLKHVEINDRSKPLLPKAKAKGQFLYESEKDNAHNVLLKEIQQGTKLKSVKTNDRSKPNLEGLRKFRRQMTIEEQIQKSVSMASMAGMPMALQNNPSMASIALQNNPSMASIVTPEELAVELDALDDELDDIDKVRDDLQSTKQLLAIEMRNKEAQIRENKRLQSRIQNLEKDIDENRTIAQNEKEADKRREPDEKLIVTLKAEAVEARKRNAELDKKLTITAKELDHTKNELEEMKRLNSELEKRLQEYMTGKRASVADRRESMMYDEDGERDDDEDDEDGEESEEKAAKRGARELKMLVNKLRGFKNKVDNAKKERVALKEIMKKHQTSIREEKKKFKSLQKEVNKMAALMKESESDEDEEDASDEEEREESSEEETTESETESSDTESESERSQSEPEDAPLEKKKENVVARSRRHENRLAALKKTNFMLKTNAERLQEDYAEQKEMTATLQNDLDSVLADLG